MLLMLRERLVPKMLEELCLLNGASGDENAVRDFIIKEIKNYCGDFPIFS